MPLPFVQRARQRAKQGSAPTRVLTFKPLARWEMIIVWHPDLKKNPSTQRLGFKAENGFAEATEKAIDLVRLFNSLYGKTKTESETVKFCRLVAVYEERAFKDYSTEPLYNKEEQKKSIQQRVEQVKSDQANHKMPKKITKQQVRVR